MNRKTGEYSTVFSWNPDEFHELIESCERDEATPFILRYMPVRGKIVEIGCGLGRYVSYLSSRGYKIEGIEYNEDTVRIVNHIAPDLMVFQGDALKLPYGESEIEGIISLGLVEHFPSGCAEPLREMHRVLKAGGRMVITVPCFNFLRRIKKHFFWHEMNHHINPIMIAKRSPAIRKIFCKAPRTANIPLRKNRRGLYEVFPPYGDFFEYRLTKKEFEEVILDAGFSIIESVPIGHMDGVFHEFGRLFVTFRNWQLFPNIFGRWLNHLFSKIPFFHNHMHLCVAVKK